MKNLLILLLSLNVIFFLMHEFDAFHKGEWKMFKFLRGLKEETQYLVFLYSHFFFCVFLFYYLWTVYNLTNFPLWILVNFLGVLHLIIHLIARTWESNVFISKVSYTFIWGIALTGIVNLVLIWHYRIWF